MKLSILAVCLASLAAAPAFAHATLLESSPTANSTVTTAAVIDLTFSEEITSDVGVSLTHSGKSVALDPVALATNYSVVTVSPKSPLAPGRYTVKWHNTSRDDGHKASGRFSFTVQ